MLGWGEIESVWAYVTDGGCRERDGIEKGIPGGGNSSEGPESRGERDACRKQPMASGLVVLFHSLLDRRSLLWGLKMSFQK